MRVLVLNYEYPPLGGGAANATKYLLAEYAKIPGLYVDLVTSATDGKTSLQELSSRVYIHSVSIGDKRSNLHHQSIGNLLRYTWSGYFTARALMRASHYDAVHAFFGVPCGLMALLLTRKNRVPYVVSLRGSDVPGYSNRFAFLYAFLRPIVRRVWRRAAAVVANSQGLLELARDTSKQQKIEVIPNGVDVQKFRPDATQRPSNEIILTVGATRITARKGIRFLLEAVAPLIAQYPQLRVEILGEGSEKAELESQVVSLGLTEHVRFLGYVSPEETPRYYQRAGIFVLPSLNEGMSNALLEALASGLPLIVTDTGGSKELVIEGENGLYIEKESAESIREALEQLLVDKSIRQRMGEASRRRAESQSWQSVAEQYMDVYKNV
jgi:glycosyltransferase involved in cell wall biosynthesis